MSNDEIRMTEQDKLRRFGLRFPPATLILPRRERMFSACSNLESTSFPHFAMNASGVDGS
jgi:hypothetical protein